MEPMTREEALAMRGAHTIDELPKDVHPGGEPEDPPGYIGVEMDQPSQPQ
jgi:hypothetical protein